MIVRVPSDSPSTRKPPLASLAAACTVAGAVAVVIAAGLSGCKVKDPPPITEAWSDNFDRNKIGQNYYNTGGGYELIEGALRTHDSYNHPLWLRKKLPRNAIIEFDAWSDSPAGDIKVEIYGDGMSHASNKGQYTSSGYVLVMGGWGNAKSILARGNEHGKDLAERRRPKVEQGKRYRWKIERKDGRIDWWVDGEKFLSYDDPKPLFGTGHEYLGFNNWESELGFDNLVVTPL